MPRISTFIHHLRYRVLERLLREKQDLEEELNTLQATPAYTPTLHLQQLLDEQIQDLKNTIALINKDIQRTKSRITYLSCA